MLSEEFEACNTTELYQLCRQMGLPINPSTSKSLMISYISGEEEPAPEPHIFDLWRHALMGFILDHWSVLESQLTCPAKSKDPRSCFGCVGTQVITCLVQNKAYEHLIALHRKE